MELWDAYRGDGTLAGCNLVRGEVIPDGLFHLVSEIIVRHEDGMFLLTSNGDGGVCFTLVRRNGFDV